MRIHTVLVGALVGIIASGPSLANDVDTAIAACRDVYRNSTTDISVMSRRTDKLDIVFRNTCTSSGDIRSGSTDITISTVVEQIPIDFGFGSTDDRHSVRKFCETYNSVNQTNTSEDMATTTVVVEALRTFNQCIRFARDTNGGMTIVPSDGIGALFHINVKAPENWFTIMEAGQVTSGSCTVRDDDGTEYTFEQINEKQMLNSPLDIKGSFGIQCNRSPIEINNEGDKAFPRVEVQFTTRNYGSYKTVFVDDTFLGPITSSQYRDQLKRLEQTVASLRKRQTELLNAMQSPRVNVTAFYVGPGDDYADIQQYNDGADHVALGKGRCLGDHHFELKRLGRHASERTFYGVSCIEYVDIDDEALPRVQP